MPAMEACYLLFLVAQTLIAELENTKLQAVWGLRFSNQ